MSVDRYGRIEVGTRVRLWFVRPPDEQPSFEGTLIGRPTDVGDTIRVRWDDGRVTEINPSCSAFESMNEVKSDDGGRADG